MAAICNEDNVTARADYSRTVRGTTLNVLRVLSLDHHEALMSSSQSEGRLGFKSRPLSRHLPSSQRRLERDEKDAEQCPHLCADAGLDA